MPPSSDLCQGFPKRMRCTLLFLPKDEFLTLKCLSVTVEIQLLGTAPPLLGVMRKTLDFLLI
ncbi:MAG TPA: hypothetical protein VIS99_05280 [Terrimicrobiaceae bacterium]